MYDNHKSKRDEHHHSGRSGISIGAVIILFVIVFLLVRQPNALIQGPVNSIGDLIGAFFGLIGGAIGGVFALVGQVFGLVFGLIGQIFGLVFGLIGTILGLVGGIIGLVFGVIGMVLGLVFGALGLIMSLIVPLILLAVAVKLLGIDKLLSNDQEKAKRKNEWRDGVSVDV